MKAEECRDLLSLYISLDDNSNDGDDTDDHNIIDSSIKCRGLG